MSRSRRCNECGAACAHVASRAGWVWFGWLLSYSQSAFLSERDMTVPTYRDFSRTIRNTAPRWPVKFLGGVTDRQVKVIASDSTPDRYGDILVAAGVRLDNFRRNPIVLAQHDADQPIAQCASIAINGDAVVALIEFPPAGTASLSDEYLALLKAGIVSAVSVGFLPISWEPIPTGRRYNAWEMVELSVVSVPANPNALVTERAFAGMRSRAADLRKAAAIKARLQSPALRVPCWDDGAAADPAVEAEAAKRRDYAARVAAATAWPQWW